ncbi:2-C-methyl-D-erythritol 4-phosphate cytidylyltransferase [Allofranklinella schreckenbergeri]|uniref:2-C-methyl-D-erythritol 4-phosphate cytidylyltransferase n=1 Tax=Allofranklinella schreckenbergeri TaxID=1076744 RepID=A0A3M6QWT8_9BURK|nr:2-C-methyl-D-erythritol 4-phosphate cytidylyltransferase [Allofranklinella schreckenbergeri]RMX07361.1 2-C-methyl-D-erythritol 4-phosphate cytidylyltransferase [Allofranklinella schreckenbergeri]
MPAMPNRIWALIPAAGVGLRATATTDAAATTAPTTPPQPKQYQRLLGQSLLSHTLRAFGQVPAIAHTIVVIAPGDAIFHTQAENTQPHASAHAVGGASRAESVRNGLLALRTHHGAQADDWVLVHDAARCLIAPAWIERLIHAVQGHPVGGLLALPLPDTLKQQASAGDGQPAHVAATIARSGKWLAQTPQMFRLGALSAALENADLNAITDEASAIEATGLRPLLVPASAQNIKVTYPEDFALAEAILQMRQCAPE